MARIDTIRALRDSVIPKLKVEIKAEEKSKPNSKVSPKVTINGAAARFEESEDESGFNAWMEQVESALDLQTGLELDELPEVPWKEWFASGLKPGRAVREALSIAENEEDTFDAKKYIDDDDQDSQEVAEDVLPLRKKKTDAILESFGRVSKALEEMKSTSEPILRSEPRKNKPLVSIDELAEAVQADQRSGLSLMKGKVTVASPKEEKEEEKDSETAELDEASVEGGDWKGHWKPTTVAVNKVGKKLVSAISSKEEVPYKVPSNGVVNSDEGGPEIWYWIEPQKSGSDIYFVGFKLTSKGETANDHKWNVFLKKGKGVASSTSVGSVSGVKSAGLADALGQIKNKLVK